VPKVVETFLDHQIFLNYQEEDKMALENLLILDDTSQAF
jgi:hypothetical protein